MTADDQDDINETEADQSDGSDLTDALSESDETSFITEEKKPVNRTSLLLFGVLLLGAAGYYFMYVRTGPQSAAAATAEAQQANDTINQFLSAGDKNLRVMEELRRTTDKVVSQFRNSSVAQVPVNDLQANPFKYAQEDDATTAAAAAQKKLEEDKQAARKSVQELQLQSILHGGSKRACMINNQLYNEGQTVAGFTVESITPNGVIVKQGPFRFQLKMQR